MADLIALLSLGKGSWGHVNGLISNGEWDKIYLITNDFGKEKFTPNENTELLVCNLQGETEEISLELQKKLKGKVKGEVGVNFISGTGKEHMALISALIKLGVGFRLVISDQEKGVVEL